MVRKTSS